jgi:ABC-type dipeptide/oligopeptide/nickel transport system permease component
LPITLLLNLVSIPLVYLLAIIIGVQAATKRGQSFDVASGTALLALWSVPVMLAGILLIGIFASAQNWHWFPESGLSSRGAADMPFLPRQVQACVSNIESLLVDIDEQELDAAVDTLANADNVTIIGSLSSAGFADYFAYLTSWFDGRWSVAGRNGVTLASTLT